MSRPAQVLSRMVRIATLKPADFQRRCARAKPGSVLIVVLALLMLMALLGTAYITTSRTDRYSAQQNSFNTEVDLLLDAVVRVVQDKIATAPGNPNDTATGANYSIATSVDKSEFLAERLPVMLDSLVSVGNNKPGWGFVSAPTMGTTFESPYVDPAPPNGWTPNYSLRQNLVPDSIAVTINGQTTQYPALRDPTTNFKFLAASASGDGIADGGLWRIPIGEVNGITYYAAVRVIDNNSAVNASIAYKPNDANDLAAYTNDLYGNFFPTNIDLLGLLRAGGGQTPAQQMTALNTFRWNGTTCSLNMMYDPSPAMGQTLPATWVFISPYDAMWQQLGRRLGNPGLNGSAGTKFQSFAPTDAAALAHRFCLLNGGASASMLETMLSGSVINNVRSTPYAPSQSAQWFSDNFNYTAGAGNIRPLLTTRNPTSNISPSRLTSKDWAANGQYTFGDLIANPKSATGNSPMYVCIMDNGSAGVPTIPPTGDPNSVRAWVPMPWSSYPVKTSITAADFGQLWIAFNSIISDDSHNTVPTDATNKPTDPTLINSTRAMLRSPLRSATGRKDDTKQAAAPGGPATPAAGAIVSLNDGNDDATVQNAINKSQPGDTLNFSGTFQLTKTVNFLAGRTYLGGPGGGTLYDMSPSQVMELRSALAAINAQQLRSRSSDIISRLIPIGGALKGSLSGGSSTTFVYTSGGDAATIQYSDSTGPTRISGIAFKGQSQGTLTNGLVAGNTPWNDVTVDHCGFENMSANGVDMGGNGSTKVTVKNGTFKHIGGTGVWGNPVRDNITVDNNAFDYAFEAIHMFAGNGNNNTDVSGNVISHAQRHGIELQNPMNNLKVNNNFLSDWVPAVEGGHDGHLGLSIAIGGWPERGIPGARNVEIGGNAVLQTGPGQDKDLWAKFAIEIMGGLISCHDNFVYGWGGGELVGNDGPLTSTNNTFAGDSLYGDYPHDSVPWPIVPVVALGDKHNDSANPPSPPSNPAQDNSTTTPTNPNPLPGSNYAVMVYGAAPQPYVTEVYANNDPSTTEGYVAIEFYNPYSYDMPLRNWKLATLARQTGVTALAPTAVSQDWSTTFPTVPAKGYLVITSPPADSPAGVTPPHGSGGTPTNYQVEPGLSSALGNELVLLRPRSASGSLSSSLDPNNPYDETKISDLIPVDSYDFTGLEKPVATSTVPGYEWHYARPNDPGAGKAWHFVYPGPYTNSPPASKDGSPVPRQGGTVANQFGVAGNYDLSQSAPYAFGSLKSATLDPATYKDAPLQINNTGFGGPNKNATAFPFGGFARNGDILQTTFVGGYRVQLLGDYIEFNGTTMDAAFADDQGNASHAGENIGRFCLLHPADCAGQYDDFANNGTRSPYYFSRRLFDFVSVHAPSNDYLPNFDPSDPSAPKQPVANANPLIVNAQNPVQTEDNVGTDGLININTANWRVLATLPMVDDPTANQKLAQAIVAYRDGDAVNGIAPHGAFNSILDLVGMPNFRNTLGAYKNGNFDPMTADPGNADGDLSPYNANGGTTDQVVGDFESQFLALTRISNLITTRSDSFTAYVVVQGWRGAGTATPELVVQRRAAFFADRSGMTPTNKVLNTNNIPSN